MKLKSLFLVVMIACLAGSAFAQPAKHVIMVPIDGLRPDFYLDPSWGMVNARQIMKQGAYANMVNSVFPSYTYPSHTTMVTGALPVRHGITGLEDVAPLVSALPGLSFDAPDGVLFPGFLKSKK